MSTRERGKRFDQTTIDRAVALVRDGQTHAAAALAVGATTSTVGVWCRAAGVNTKYKPGGGPHLARATASPLPDDVLTRRSVITSKDLAAAYAAGGADAVNRLAYGTGWQGVCLPSGENK